MSWPRHHSRHGISIYKACLWQLKMLSHTHQRGKIQADVLKSKQVWNWMCSFLLFSATECLSKVQNLVNSSWFPITEPPQQLWHSDCMTVHWLSPLLVQRTFHRKSEIATGTRNSRFQSRSVVFGVWKMQDKGRSCAFKVSNCNQSLGDKTLPLRNYAKHTNVHRKSGYKHHLQLHFKKKKKMTLIRAYALNADE